MSNNNPHDSFAKEVLSRRENVECFFRGILPPEVGKRLDFRTLREDKTSYTDENLDEYFSDVVYTCRYAGSTLKIALLFEHKSYIPAFPHSQLLRYILNIWDRQVKQHKPVPIVVPILFYHGKTAWKPRALKDSLSGDTVLFARFIPGFDYLLVDLAEFSEEKITGLFTSNAAVRLWLLIQKYIYTPETLVFKLDSFFNSDIVYLSSEEGLRFLESLCRYIFRATTIDGDRILKTARRLPERAREAIMTTAEKLIEQGIERGLEQGLEQGIGRGKQEAKREDARRMIEKGYPVEDICDITGLSREEVQTLRQG